MRSRTFTGIRTLVMLVMAAGQYQWCPAAQDGGGDVNTPQDSNMATIFVTGNTLGQLRPCGCSGGQLGGFERRPTITDKVPPAERLLVDTGRFIENTDQQNLIKFDIISQALTMLEYDVSALNAKDLATAQSLGSLETGNVRFITAVKNEVNIPAVFTKDLRIGAGTKRLAVIAIDQANSETVAQKIASFEPGMIVIGVIDGTEVPAEVSSSLDIAIVRAEDTDTPIIKSAKGQRPFVITAGRKGKYVGRVDVKFGGPRPQFDFEAIPVTDKLVVDKDLEKLYQSYQAIVKDEDLLTKHPRFPLPAGLEYVGSKSCAGSKTMTNCHEYEYGKWKEKKHYIAMESLQKVGSDHDPECVVCHVVGFNYKGGFVKPEDEGPDKPDLMNVGCEACHGPGSKHMVTAGKARTQEPKMKCTDCHTAEQSPNFSSQESVYYNKVVHWKELKFAKPKFKIDPNIK